MYLRVVGLAPRLQMLVIMHAWYDETRLISMFACSLGYLPLLGIFDHAEMIEQLHSYTAILAPTLQFNEHSSDEYSLGRQVEEKVL